MEAEYLVIYNIRKICEEKKIEMKDLAKLMNYSEKCVERLLTPEFGKRGITVIDLENFAKALKIKDIRELFNDIDENCIQKNNH